MLFFNTKQPCKKQLSYFVSLLAILTSVLSYQARAGIKIVEGVTVALDKQAEQALSESHKQLLVDTVGKVTTHTAKLLPSFPRQFTLNVTVVSRDLDQVGGVTGVAQTPTSINIQIAANFIYGIEAAIKGGLKSTLYHEYHHLAYGWTIEGNKYGPGIAVASVVEGLATVFAEQYSEVSEEWLSYPESVSSWVEEILELPANAPYGTWMMGTHPDGRHNIGYRAGRYIIHQAIANSGDNIIELSKLSPFQLLNLSGLIYNHAPSIEKLGDFYAKTKSSQQAIATYKRAMKVTPTGNDALLTRYQKKIDLIRNPITIRPSQMMSFAGEYTSERLSASISWSDNNKQLSVQLPGRPPFVLYPESEQSFFIYEADMKFTFVPNSDDSLITLVINAFGRELPLKKK